MINKLFESLYLKIFINIVVGRSKTTVFIETNNSSGVVEHVEEVFNTLTTAVDNDMQEFIDSYIQESPFHYISFLDTSNHQGAVPTCDIKKMSKYFDVNSSISLCFFDKWSYYTSSADIGLLKKEYAKIGVDFIFSPFSILARFFKDKIDGNVAMYMLIEDSYISLAVFDKSELLYADHIQMKQQDLLDELLDTTSDDEDDELDFDGSINLDDVDVDKEMGELDDFGDVGDIEDLDSLDDIDEMDGFADVQEEEEKEVKEKVGDSAELTMDEVDAFNEDYERFLLVQSSINNFYKDDKFESEFIENIFIADGLDGSADLKRYFEEEMFLNVVMRRIDLNAEICDLAKVELK